MENFVDQIVAKLDEWLLGGGAAGGVLWLWWNNRESRLARTETRFDAMSEDNARCQKDLAVALARITVLEGQLRANKIEPYP